MSGLNVEQLRECFRLNEQDVLYWLYRPSAHFRTAQACGAANAKCFDNPVADVGNGKGHRVVKVTIAGKLHCLLVHRVVWALRTGAWPKQRLDHIDTDKANNRFGNLREASNAQNLWNRGPQRINALGLKGVCRKRGKFTARIKVNGKQHNLGSFCTAGEAASAYKQAATRLHGEFARTE